MAQTTKTRQAKASMKYVRMSPRKVRLVLDLIRDKHVEEARRILRFTPKSAAHEVAKVLDAAIANAENTLRVPPEALFVATAFADGGPTLKRFMPRAQGRATQIRKRTCHIHVVVEQREGR
jgi:large subunit ribosomal protein L22